jgi:L-ascorbate metabolism protein UlaG (beta-lactamase superfamily)
MRKPGFGFEIPDAPDGGEQGITRMMAGPFHITALPTLHSDAAGIGLLIRAGGLSVYHSGDTEYTTALAKDLEKRLVAAPVIALLCINGRLGNMT